MTSPTSKPNKPEPVAVNLPSAISVADLSTLLKVSPIEIVKALMRGGYMFAVNDVIERDIASVVCQLFGYKVQEYSETHEENTRIVPSTESESDEELSERPPIVTILGHVDHGKTTLLDQIRKANVVQGEAGGITQHIGAYQVSHNNSIITFLDTPGHEAFTAMRARGARVTDIVILVVAADDGVMPQTAEAIDHARAADVPMIVAITKKDLPNADIEKVYRQLSENDLLIEDWGGDIIAVPLSGLTGDGVDQLLESIELVAEISEYKANANRGAVGVVVEARTERSRGAVATLLVQTGTLNQGDIVVTGNSKGRIRAMFDDGGNRVKKAGPSTPVEIMGLNEVPEAGDLFQMVANEKEARKLVDERLDQTRRQSVTLQDAYSRTTSDQIRQIDLIVKTDVQGTVEPIKAALEDLNSNDTKVNIIHTASGSITERDVLLAIASEAIIIGFNSQPEGGAETLAKQEGVEIRSYSVIYQLIEDVHAALEGQLEPTYQEVYVGRATVRAVFNLSRHSKIAGIYVNDGKIFRDSDISVVRRGDEIYRGAVSSLKHFKDDVREITTGFEGGLTIDGFVDFEEDDILEAFSTEAV